MIKRLLRILNNWFDWQDAKSWAREYRPAWLYIAQRSNNEATRQRYREKILRAYMGE